MRKSNTNPTTEDTHSSATFDDAKSGGDDSTSPRGKLSLTYILDTAPTKNNLALRARHGLNTSNTNANGNASDIPKEAPADTSTPSSSGLSRSQSHDRVQNYHALQAKNALQRLGTLSLGLTEKVAKALKVRDLEEMVRICRTIAASGGGNGIRSSQGMEAEIKHLEEMLRVAKK
ncbi:hypothetical protein QBC32DRAFT_319021 [Pseudoneurospora amorphoporcata]|uniref:Uncharacterized protein n=1 Tax=Pseudoneurospora amorphoporcata TaxID=241081 RepID=A0AAN6NK20_9PEZI|nr:hypothetical protein QBC32DRAFT_319021 [Pseudoneurospora amorphoporcata]